MGDIVTKTFLMRRSQPRRKLGVAWGGSGGTAQVEGTAPVKAKTQHQAWAPIPRSDGDQHGRNSEPGNFGSETSQVGRRLQDKPSMECGFYSKGNGGDESGIHPFTGWHLPHVRHCAGALTQLRCWDRSKRNVAQGNTAHLSMSLLYLIPSGGPQHPQEKIQTP